MQQQNDGRNAFDFLIGKWKVHHFRLKERLKGCTEWEEFEGEGIARKILNGLGNMDENILHRASGDIHAITVRLFDPKSKEWSLCWSAEGAGTFDVPMIGGFKNGRGDFFAQEVFEGRHIFSRFIWSEIEANTCKWEQAFSIDGGKTWETNWVMTFERV